MSELILLLPQLCLLLSALLILVYNNIFPKSTKLVILTGIATVGSLGSISTAIFLFSSKLQLGSLFGDLIVVDGSSLFFVVIISSVTLLVSIASYDYINKLGNQAEYYSLLLLAATGMGLMASANSLVIAFIAMELASLPS